ncbi:unnamed protein product, partial [Urochloa humidicola]
GGLLIHSASASLALSATRTPPGEATSRPRPAAPHPRAAASRSTTRVPRPTQPSPSSVLDPCSAAADRALQSQAGSSVREGGRLAPIFRATPPLLRTVAQRRQSAFATQPRGSHLSVCPFNWCITADQRW